jgi:hypothetical protein
MGDRAWGEPFDLGIRTAATVTAHVVFNRLAHLIHRMAGIRWRM